MTRIAVIDDHRLFASGLAAVIAPLGAVETYDTAQAALAALAARPADLVLLDFYVPGGHAVETIAALLGRGLCRRVVVISASLSPSDRAASMAAGAVAFVPKHSAPDQLMEICRAALEAPGGAAGPEAPAPTPAPAAEGLGLTARQLDVLVMMGHGYANREIAALLEIGPETVKSHVKAVFEKLGASSRTQAIAFARDRGLL